MLGQILKKLRENCGYTQQQVADALNLERSTYTYYETGKTTPDINTIVKLARIFNVSYIDIFEQEERDQTRSFNDYSLYSKDDLRNVVHIYELTKMEKVLISLYRLLPSEQQEIFINELKDRAEEFNKKDDDINLY